MLVLPQLKAKFSWIKPKSEIILIAGGRQPDINWFNEMRSDRKICCIDHGIDFCRENNILPELLIGDLDSANSDSIAWSQNKNLKINKYPVDKDLTDTQLALEQIEENNFAIITGAFGGRLDHLYSMLFTCANASIKNCLADDHETVLFLSDSEQLRIEFISKPLALSLLPISEICQGVSIDGVHWPLRSATLTQSLPNAISNRVEAEVVNIFIENGKLAIYCCFEENI